MLLKITRWTPSSNTIVISSAPEDIWISFIQTKHRRPFLQGAHAHFWLSLIHMHALTEHTTSYRHAGRSTDHPSFVWHTAGWSCAQVRGCHQPPVVASYAFIFGTFINATTNDMCAYLYIVFIQPCVPDTMTVQMQFFIAVSVLWCIHLWCTCLTCRDSCFPLCQMLGLRWGHLFF